MKKDNKINFEIDGDLKKSRVFNGLYVFERTEEKGNTKSMNKEQKNAIITSIKNGFSVFLHIHTVTQILSCKTYKIKCIYRIKGETRQDLIKSKEKGFIWVLNE